MTTMHFKTIACVLLSLLTASTCQAGPTQAKYPTIAQDALDWCFNEMQGVPLWKPDPNEDFKTTEKGIARVADARDFEKDKNEVTQARVAAMAVWAKHNPEAIQKAFLVGDNKPSSWCLSGKDKMTIAAQFKNDSEGGDVDFVKEGDDLKKMIEDARSLGGKDGLSMWSYFINHAYAYADVEQSRDVSASNDLCAQAANREGCMREEAPKDLRSKSEAAAVHFLRSTTGKECEIVGGYEQDNTDVVNILMRANDSPVIVIVSDKEDNSGFWPVVEAVGNASDPESNKNMNIRVWDSEQGVRTVFSVPGPYKVVHYKDV